MAIYLNDRILKADPKGSSIEREYYEGTEKVKKLFAKFRKKDEATAYIQIARNIKDSERVFSMKTNKTKRVPPIALPVEIPYYDDEMGATAIRYSATPPQATKEGGLTYATKYIEFRETLTITDKQIDLAWFLLFASNLVKKGIYQLVDVQAKYEGTYAEIMLRKDVVDYLSADEELLKHIAQKFINEAFVRLEPIELFVKVNGWLEANKRWEEVHGEILKFNGDNILSKNKLTDIEWDGEPVQMLQCPAGVKAQELKAEAVSLGIKLTVPPQTKDVLYSLIQHIKNK